MLLIVIVLYSAAGYMIYPLATNQIVETVPIVLLIVFFIAAFILSFGFMIIEPNNSKVLLLFGSYQGTVRESGFKWANPFFSKRLLSLRARTLNGEKLKVNDLAGNPVEIAAIVVWRELRCR